MSNKIHIIFPTEVEAQYFTNPDTERYAVEISGVGLCECGSFSAQLIAQKAPRMVILAGIGGAYPDSGLTIGDVVVVGSETASDQGAFRDHKFTPLYQQTYTCDFANRQHSLKIVAGSSVNAAAADFFDPQGRKVESMEGAAFFATAIKLGTPFLELRSISNFTNSTRAEWKLNEATKTLAEALYRLLDEIDA